MDNHSAARDTPVSVSAFEKEHKIRLPENYARFLAERPSGLNRKVFDIPPDGRSALSELFSTTSQLNEAVVRSADWLPAGMLHIGYDIGGNWICLGVYGGQVFWVDHETLEPRLLADSLPAFIDSLTAPAEFVVEDPVELVGMNGGKDEALALIARMGPALKSNAGRSLAQEASRYGNIDVLSLCHELEHDLRGCLHLAAMNDERAMVEHLVGRCKLDINEPNERGFTPLQFVMFDQSLKDWMVQNGALPGQTG